jgi:hypothetical protein
MCACVNRYVSEGDDVRGGEIRSKALVVAEEKIKHNESKKNYFILVTQERNP